MPFEIVCAVFLKNLNTIGKLHATADDHATKIFALPGKYFFEIPLNGAGE
jgi:hypothetical protein